MRERFLMEEKKKNLKKKKKIIKKRWKKRWRINKMNKIKKVNMEILKQRRKKDEK